jgi:hypothetical protein
VLHGSKDAAYPVARAEAREWLRVF